MNEYFDYLSASDADIYDLLVSGKQRLTEAVLHEFGRDRGIFYSNEESREELAGKLSLLPHDFHDVAGIVHRREPASRREKTTSSRLLTEVSIDELKAAASDYAVSVGATEKVIHAPRGAGFYVQVTYDEYNHSRTRLLQRERHEAVIEFSFEGGHTVIRRPATDKAKRVVTALKEIVESKRRATISEETIELTGLVRPDLRSRFFTRLISSLERFRLKNVMNLKVSLQESDETFDEEDVDLEAEEGITEDARQEMLAAVHSMVLTGRNLMQSREYRDLSSRGFFITSISWSSERDGATNDIIQFDAGFEDRMLGVGFKYSVQGAFRAHNGGHRKTMAHVNAVEKAELFRLLEATARRVLAELLAESDEAGPADAGVAQGSAAGQSPDEGGEAQ